MPAYAVTVGTASVKIAEANEQRTGLTIANPHTTQILYITDDPPAVATDDFPVQPGTFISLLRKDGDVPQKTWYAVGSGAATNARVLEAFGDIVAPTPSPEPNPQDPKKSAYIDAPYMRLKG